MVVMYRAKWRTFYLFTDKGGAPFLMASKDLIEVVSSLENYISTNGVTDKAIEVYVNACNNAIIEEKDIAYGLTLTKRAKGLIEGFTALQMGRSLWDIEKYCYEKHIRYELLDLWYDILKLEAQNRVLDSYFLYLEKNREPNERFYMPKRRQFAKFGLIDAYQGALDDLYDIICISMPPGTGKTTLLKFFNSAVIGWFPKDYNLFYSHSGDITRMYYDGVHQIVSDTTEYTWNEIFPDLSITSTNAKMQQFNVGKYKPFPSLQTASVGSENAGKVRASKFLLVDDMIGRLEEALNKNILEKQWGAYTVDARQRKTMDSDNRPCKEIINATRWSTVDVIGRVMQMYEGNPRVKVIAMPDIDPATGESNFDYEYGGFTVAFFNDQAHLMDDISYKCLYKQEPIEREGLLYHEDDLRRYTTLPSREPDAIIGVCDTKSKGVDYMVLPCFYQYDDDFYMVDCICDDSSDFGMQHERLSNIIVDHNMQQCEFESNAGGDRLAHEVSQIVDKKGGRCNITTKATETNKETRIIVNSDWIKRHCLFKLKEDYTPKSDYGRFMGQMLSYSVAGKNKNDDVPDCLANFALFVSRKNRIRKTIIMEGFL